MGSDWKLIEEKSDYCLFSSEIDELHEVEEVKEVRAVFTSDSELEVTITIEGITEEDREEVDDGSPDDPLSVGSETNEIPDDAPEGTRKEELVLSTDKDVSSKDGYIGVSEFGDIIVFLRKIGGDAEVAEIGQEIVHIPFKHVYDPRGADDPVEKYSSYTTPDSGFQKIWFGVARKISNLLNHISFSQFNSQYNFVQVGYDDQKVSVELDIDPDSIDHMISHVLNGKFTIYVQQGSGEDRSIHFVSFDIAFPITRENASVRRKDASTLRVDIPRKPPEEVESGPFYMNF